MNQRSQPLPDPGNRSQTSTLCHLPDNFPSNMMIVAHDGRISYITNRMLALVGLSRTEAIGQKAGSFFSMASSDHTLPDILDDCPITEARACLHSRNGNVLPVLLSADLWRNHDGIHDHIVTVTDTAALEQEDELLRHKSFRLQSCLEGTKAGTWEWNVQTGETRFNERWAEIVGYKLEELEPISIETWLNLAHPEDLELSSRRLEDHFSGKEPFYDIDSRMKHKDGHHVWVRDRGRVFTWTDDGKPEWMFGTHFLIDREKRVEEDLRRNLSMLDRMGQIAGVGGWELDLQTGQLRWSDETRRIHGVDKDYVPSVEEGISFYAPEARPIISKAVEKGMQSGQAWDLELPFIRQSGERIWVRAVGEVEFEAEKPRRIIGAFQDITGIVHFRNELIAAKEWTTLAAAEGGVGLWSLDIVSGQLNWDMLMATHFGFDADNSPTTVSDWMNALSLQSASKLKAAIRDGIFAATDIDLELTLDLGEGRMRYLKLVGAPHLDQEENVDRLQGACFDLTEQRQLTERLEEQASKLTVTLSSIGDGIITTNEAGRITWMNCVAEEITGRTLKDVEGVQSREVLKIIDEETRNDVPCPIERCLSERVVIKLSPETLLARPDRIEVAIDNTVAPLLDSEKKLIGAVMVLRDTTAQRNQARDVAFRANHDSLTGLMNRSAFNARLEKCLADPLKRNGSYLFLIDLDHFKRINDSVGHSAGDAVLTCTADILRESVDKTSAVSRLGGDEFAMLLRAKTQSRALEIGQDLCRRAAKSTPLKRSSDMKLDIGMSIGIVSLANPQVTPSEAMRMADIALYSAKASGKGQARLWNEDDNSMTAMSRQTSLINLIETAIKDCSWHVHEQCIQRADMIGDSSHFAELLIRLPDGNGGLIAPSDFMPAAERYGMMQVIDEWMCSYALDRIGSQSATGFPKMFSVNISASSINSESFKEYVLELLNEAPSAVRELLCFEVTETSILVDYQASQKFLAKLRSLGASVAIDDFGAGATSFKHFQHLPADYLKIDGSFIRNMTNPIEATCIECFLRMADVSNFKTIAEHVESEEQIDALAAMNIDFLQGYALERPQ